MNHENSTSAMPLNLFDAVAQNDYEGMISIWATGCNRALLSISRLKRAPYRRSSEFSALFQEVVEEKRDEVMQQHGTTSQSFHANRGLDGDIEVALQEIEIVLSSLVGDDNVKPSSLSTDHMDLGSESDFHRFRLQNRHHAASSAPRIPFFPSLYNSSPIRRGSIWSSLTKCSSREQVDSFLFEKARSISNLRPNASFVINLDNGTEKNGNEGPLFDGAIANATPLGNYSSGGGVGTILHLACALDLPFALAMLLVMGADASARHTAFRRLMLHEAACSNSPKCLRLLLEMGQQHYSDLIAKGISVAGLNYTPLWNAESSKSQIINDVKQSGLKSSVNTNMPTQNTKHMDFSYPEILCICLKYAKMVKNNQLSDYDAAVALMSEVSISDQNKYFIASTCRVHFDDINTSDGHGNTALHWAAFKNSYSCSELLLTYQSNVNAKATSSGWTPLHDAAYSESIETLSLLITAGADVNAKASSGASPLCFAAQEDAPTATSLLLKAGADPTLRCCDEESVNIQGSNYSLNRFSGYTPLHYAAHYNSQKAARVLLEYHSNVLIRQEKNLLEISDLNDKLPIHIAVARGSSDVLRELLHYGARVDTRPTRSISMSSSVSDDNDDAMDGILTRSNYRTQSFDEQMEDAEDDHDAVALSPTVTSASSILPSSSFRLVTPVSSPVLRSMIPQVPVESVKPWNCISQRSIDECRLLIQEAESSWSPDRHSLFHPRDRAAVLELLRVGKRLEQKGTGIFIDLWPLVLSFCGRGWFEPESDHPQPDASFPFPLPSI